MISHGLYLALQSEICYNSLMIRQKLVSALLIASMAVVYGVLSLQPVFAASSAGNLDTAEPIKLLAPLDDSTTTIAVSDPLGAWFKYFEISAGWLYDVAIGFCVLWVLIGGFQVMISGDDATKRGEGFDKMQSAIFGLVMLIFAPVILRFLNNNFFK